MSHVEGNRITLPSVYRIRGLPGLPAPEYVEQQSLMASTRSAGTPIRDSLDDIDRGWLLTNVHRHTDQRSYMVNAQRDDPQEKQKIKKLLIDLGLARSHFKLDDISNIAWSDATLHTAMDKYDIFAITVSLNYGKNILDFLEEDLANRQSVMDETGRLLPRNFQYFPSTEFQLVVLHPDQLLPHGSTLLQRNVDDSYTPYKVSSDKLLRQVDPLSILSSDRPSVTAPPFPPFSHQTTRSLPQTLNIYFVLINAEVKFQRFAKNFGLDKLHSDMRAIAEQTIRIVDLIYSQPVRSGACIAIQAAARSKWSMRAVNNAEGIDYENEDRMEAGGPTGATSDAALRMGEGDRESLLFSWDTLSHEDRKALGRDLLSRGSAFRRRSTPDNEEGVSGIHAPDEGTHPLLLPIAPHHRNKEIRDWAEGIE